MASLNDIATRTGNLEKNKLNISGGTLTGHIVMSGSNVITTSHNYGIKGTKKDGTSDYIMYVDASDNLHIGYSNHFPIYCDGEVRAAKVYNAVWNDYAEFYPRGEYTEAGDIIQLDINSKEEKYIKATSGSTTVVGVHSDTYGHLIGGEDAPDGREFVEYNLEKYIPVGLVGRVNCKVIGKINKGDRIVVSDIAGVGRKFNPETDNVFQIVGMAVENKYSENIEKIKANFRGGGGVNSRIFLTNLHGGGLIWLV